MARSRHTRNPPPPRTAPKCPPASAAVRAIQPRPRISPSPPSPYPHLRQTTQNPPARRIEVPRLALCAALIYRYWWRDEKESNFSARGEERKTMINRQLWAGVTLFCVMAFTGCANNTGGNAAEAAQAEPKETPAPKWQAKQAPLMTRWAKDVSPDNVHPEYPRPQMVRKDWLNLNGLWDYAITPA